MLAKTTAGHNGSSLSSLLEAQNADGQTALHLACRRGSVELVEAILEYKEANVDVLDKDGDPPLVFALASGSPECVRALINKCQCQICVKRRSWTFNCSRMCLPWPTRLHVCKFLLASQVQIKLVLSLEIS